MKLLRYETLKQQGYDGYLLKQAPEKVLQFGEGNFLRAFADYFLDCANEKTGWNGKAAVVQPISRGLAAAINEQEGLYTLYLRGREEGVNIDQKRVISVISRCINPYEDFAAVLELARSPELELIISNTTEAGIVYDPEASFDHNPPESFPAKLTRVLYERYRSGLAGLVILSCELIDRNGRVLADCVGKHIRDWKLGQDFADWVERENLFCSTLVDRIVPGRITDPKQIARLEEENGYRDRLIDVGEWFGVWIIEGPAELEERLPFAKAGLNVRVVCDVTPYKQRKVRILNGAHTGFAPGAYLAGEHIVRDCMDNPVILRFMNRMLDEEIIPGLPLEREDLESFAQAVRDRFANPFINHQLLSICLNSVSKWRTRNLPSLLTYWQMYGKLPACLTMSLSACIAFYSLGIRERTGDALVCARPDGEIYKVRDDDWVLDFFYLHREDEPEQLAASVLSHVKMWGQDLTEIPGLAGAVAENLKLIGREGALAAMASCAEGKEER